MMLKVSDLAFAYGDAEPVLQGVNLQVSQGEFVSLIGPSGCGKSTLLRSVMGLQPPSSGRIQLETNPRDIGFLFQNNALLPWRSARDNVALGLRAHGYKKRQAREQADEWLARMGLQGLGSRFPRELSGGQRKRVAIAQVLALQPKFLLMDEPFASLDAIVRRYITEDLMNWLEQDGISVLMVTHDLEEAAAVSDRVVLLGNGPRATVKAVFDVNLPRPRDLIGVRQNSRYTALVQRMWNTLAKEIQAPRRAPKLELVA